MIFKDKMVAVTGGAQGIGKCCAECFAREGATVHVAEADWIGMASGYDHDKIAEVGWTTTKAETVNAPVINELKLTVECKVVNTVDIGSHTQITGEVVNIQADESILDERGKYDLAKLNPIIYDEEQFAYRTVGGKTADAFKVGLVYKNK